MMTSISASQDPPDFRHDPSGKAALRKGTCESSMRTDLHFTGLGQNRFNTSNRILKVVHDSISKTLAQRHKSRFDYFALPPEIRNEIMCYVLVPGDVHIRGIKKHGVKAKIQHAWDTIHQLPEGYPELPSVPSLPGFQMLATCKTVYGQYHETFYSSNTFFFAPGPFKETIKYYTLSLQPEHVNMINRIGVTLGLEDLTPDVFKKVHEIMSHNLRSLPSDSVGREWGFTVQVHLSDIWQRKLGFLGSVQGLKMVKLATKDEVLETNGADLRDAFNGIGTVEDDFKNCAMEVTALVERAKTNVKKEIAERVDRDGWRALRAWVYKGGFRSRL